MSKTMKKVAPGMYHLEGPKGLPTETDVDIDIDAMKKKLKENKPSESPTATVSVGGLKAMVVIFGVVASVTAVAFLAYVLYSDVFGRSCSLLGSGVDLTTCTCFSGYNTTMDGSYCLDRDECLLGIDSCEQMCVNVDGGYRCDCYEGFFDSSGNCQDIDECMVNNGGCSQSCSNTIGSYNCSCLEGFQMGMDGKLCIDVNECEENHGCPYACVNAWGSYHCACADGYKIAESGLACIYDPAQCGLSGSQVQNGRCACNVGYTPSPSETTCIDQNECETMNGGCAHQCYNNPGSYNCGCDPGYELKDNLLFCEDINECWLADNECTDGCENSMGSYACTCQAGRQWDSDALECIDIDECSTDDIGGCAIGCVNTDGSYFCTCLEGWQIATDGVTCIDLDECIVANGGCSHECHNEVGSFRCTCPEGKEVEPPQNLTCTDINECLNNNGGCADSEICVNTDGSFLCITCDDGYTGNTDGECVDINECEGTDHGCGSETCFNSAGSYNCGCPSSTIDIYDDASVCAVDPSTCCSGSPCTITEENVFIITPNFPYQYNNNADCKWRITIDGANNGIRLQWIVFNLETDYDFVHAWNSDSMSGSPTTRTGGSAYDISSSGPAMFVQFESDGSVTENGFLAQIIKL